MDRAGSGQATASTTAPKANPKATAVIAGAGRLPEILCDHIRAHPDLFGPLHIVRFVGQAGAETADQVARYEQMGALFAGLKAAGVRDVVFAGAMQRPDFDPSLLDDVTRAILPELMATFSKGDDHLLRRYIALFEAEGFTLVAAQDMCPDLTLKPGTHLGADALVPNARADAQVAQRILDALDPLDIAQCAVVAGGLTLGIETLQGTAFLLESVARTPPNLRRAPAVLVKRPKVGQDVRVDMPAIGPDTITQAEAAGICAIFIPAGLTLVLDRNDVDRAAKAANIRIETL